MKAAVSLRTLPTSTAPATPTKPPAMPPANEKVWIRLAARTFTSCAADVNSRSVLVLTRAFASI